MNLTVLDLFLKSDSVTSVTSDKNSNSNSNAPRSFACKRDTNNNTTTTTVLSVVNVYEENKDTTTITSFVVGIHVNICFICCFEGKQISSVKYVLEIFIQTNLQRKCKRKENVKKNYVGPICVHKYFYTLELFMV